MSEDLSSTSENRINSALDFPKLFFQSIISPSVGKYNTLREISLKHKSLFGVWIFLFSWIGLSLSYLLNFASRGLLRINYVCISPFFGLIGILTVAMYAVITHFVLKVMGGQGKLVNMFFLLGAILSPLMLFTGVFNGISSYFPDIGVFSYIIWIYAIYPMSIAMKTEHNVDTLKALIASILVFTVIFVLELI